MIDSLIPIWKQSQETHAVIRKLIADATDEQLHWKPQSEMWSISDIVQHVARGNVVYSMMMEGLEPVRRPPIEQPSKAQLIEILNSSELIVSEAFGRISPEDLAAARADDWCPLGLDVQGPLDSMWFSVQIVRHTAYHAGQISYILQLP